MTSSKQLIASCAALLAMAGMLAAEDATSAAVAALKANLGDPANLEVDEVRVTNIGVACIDYRLGDAAGGKNRGHAVVQGEEVLKSSEGSERFETAWSEHCLGPRGGITSEP